MEKTAFDLVLKCKQGFWFVCFFVCFFTKNLGITLYQLVTSSLRSLIVARNTVKGVATVWIQCFLKAGMVKDWSCPIPILFCFLVDLKWAPSCTMDLARSRSANGLGLTPLKQSNESFPLLSSSFQALSYSNGKK